MARKKQYTPWYRKINLSMNLKEETKRGVFSILLFALSIFLILASFHQAGVAGTTLYDILNKLVGIGFYLLPLLLILLGISFLKDSEHNLAISHSFGSTIFFLSGLGLIDLLGVNHSGGILGEMIASPFIKLFDVYISFIFLIALLVVSLLIIFNTLPQKSSLLFWRRFRKENKKEEYEKEEEEEYEEEDGDEEVEEEEEVPDDEIEEKPKSTLGKIFNKNKKDAKEEAFESIPFHPNSKKFTPPPLSLLERDKGKPDVGDIKANANIIKRTLKNFGIDVEMDEISIGPSITRYALKPAEGVKLSRIVGLQNDLSLALAAHPIRIEAPIPGKSLVGIEIPNSSKSTVGLASILSDPEYKNSNKSLLLGLGRGISGKSYFGNLGKMPHILIAGATGSGKSVTIHTIINSLLYRNAPENLRFIMVDPKRVELTLYNGIPHLLTPVITDAKKAILALRWAAKEMERRYDILETESVRDIDSYRKNIVSPAYIAHAKKKNSDPEEAVDLPERMPYIVIIIDELADIMTSYPRELEAAIVRLAQMSRAVGIHLILSTQRPSVNIITGLIKANIPARVALQVSSQIDSRTILDASGAEKLLGAGDMLYISGEMSKPQRIQSAFITENEVKKVVKYLTDYYKNEVPNEINLTEYQKDSTVFESSIDGSNSLEEDDELYEDAKTVVIEAGKASSSYLQRRLKVGYSRAARLIDMLEERGVVGQADGSKPREILNQEEEEYNKEDGYLGKVENENEDEDKDTESVEGAEKGGKL